MQGRPEASQKCRWRFMSNMGTRSTITNRFQKTTSQFIESEFEQSSERKMVNCLGPLAGGPEKSSSPHFFSQQTWPLPPRYFQVSEMKIPWRTAVPPLKPLIRHDFLIVISPKLPLLYWCLKVSPYKLYCFSVAICSNTLIIGFSLLVFFKHKRRLQIFNRVCLEGSAQPHHSIICLTKVRWPFLQLFPLWSQKRGVLSPSHLPGHRLWESACLYSSYTDRLSVRNRWCTLLACAVQETDRDELQDNPRWSGQMASFQSAQICIHGLVPSGEMLALG